MAFLANRWRAMQNNRLSNYALLASYRLTIPIGVLVLSVLCGILWFTSDIRSSMSISPSVGTIPAEVAHLSYPMLSPSDVTTNSFYLVQAGTGGDTDIFALSSGSPTATLTNLTDSAGIAEVWPVSSHDGERVAFYAIQNGISNLVVFQENRSVLDLTYHSSSSGLNEEYSIDLRKPPTWSPADTWIAFLAQQNSGAGQAIELFIVRSDGTETRKLTQNGNQVIDLTWISDTELIYVERLGNGRAILYKLSITQSPSTPEALTDQLAFPVQQ